jgi:hypothetical protein
MNAEKETAMTGTEKLLRDIEALRESIAIDWEDLRANPLREEERNSVRTHLEACQAELKKLISRFLTINEAEMG